MIEVKGHNYIGMVGKVCFMYAMILVMCFFLLVIIAIGACPANGKCSCQITPKFAKYGL